MSLSGSRTDNAKSMSKFIPNCLPLDIIIFFFLLESHKLKIQNIIEIPYIQAPEKQRKQ